MKWVNRFLTGLPALAGLAAVALLSRPEIAPSAGQKPPAPVVERRAERASSWSPGVRVQLEGMGLPVRGAELDAVLRAVDASARRFALDPLMVLAVIRVESRFDPGAVSPDGAMGLMQLRVDTARELARDLGLAWPSDDLLFDPDLNVLLGTFYLSRLITRFGDLDFALAAFHAGPTRVEGFRQRSAPISFAYAHQVWDAVVDLQVRAPA